MNEADPKSSQITSNIQKTAQTLFSEIRQLIDAANQSAAVAINAEITLLYWQVGDR
jgi:hypothetical protein